MNIRIVHDGSFGPPGGSERVAIELAKALDAPITVGHTSDLDFWKTAGVEVDIPFQESFHSGVSSRVYNTLPRPYAELCVKMKFRELEFDEDIIITTGASSRWFIPRYNQTFINYCHVPPPDYYAEPKKGMFAWAKSTGLGMVDRHFMSFYDGIISNSEFTAQRVRKHYRCDSEVLYPPIRTDEFQHREPAPDPYVVMIARLIPMKRPLIVGRAFSNLDDVRLVIIGDGQLRDECDALDNVEVRSGLSDSEVEELVSRSIAGIAFGDHEHYGMTTKEYQSAGKPVIVPKEPYLQNHVTDGVDGVSVQPTTEGVRSGVRTILESEWDSKRIQETANEHGRDRFHEKAPKLIREIYEEATESDYDI